VIKAPAVRRAELIDCAQSLFLAKGYERTTINDVIEATALSKGAFYHHFRSKEDLLEAIAERYARDSLAYAKAVQDDDSLDALQRLNALLAMSREWKVENLAKLRAMFTTLLNPQNAVLYHRIVGAVFSVMSPTLTDIIRRGEREGVFDAADPQTVADAILWLGEGRRTIVVQAIEIAETRSVDEGASLLLHRVRAEEEIMDRILGLPPGSVQLAGPDGYIRSALAAWTETPQAVADA
jgi:AcrR family transcriptional regulator